MKNILKKLPFLIFTLFVLSCGTEKREFDGTVLVSGEIKNSNGGKVVLTQLMDDKSEEITTIALNNDGKFQYELSLEGPGFYELNLMDTKIVRLALFDQDVQVIYDVQNEESLSIEGSEDTKHLQEVDRLSQEYQESVNELNEDYYNAMTKKDPEAVKEIQERAMALEKGHAEKVKSEIDKMEGSFSALAAISMLNPQNDFPYLDNLVAQLDEDYPNISMIQTLKNQLDDLRTLSIGQVAPEISLPNPEGTVVNLSDLRGKYVMIDFWAAWCRPCREENPNVVKLYNEYNKNGFEVFSVSLDRTKDAWVKAIADDQLTWTHVSDLQYFNSEAAATYKINAIPATYLLDPEGKIIAKDLRGKSLEDKLKEIFG